jgi:hypothetical protein
VRRPEAARRHQQIALEPVPQSRFELGLAVSDDSDLRRLDPCLEQRTSEERAVQVSPVAADELRAGDDDRGVQQCA